MQFIRTLGVRLSLLIIATVHAMQYWLNFSSNYIQSVRVILVDERRVILVSHWYAPWAWTLPGGGVHKDESPEAAAVREVREEVGLHVKSLAGEIGRYQGRWGRGDMIAVYYTGDFDGSLALTPNLEIMARSWFPIDDLPPELSPANRKRIEAYRDGVRGDTGVW